MTGYYARLKSHDPKDRKTIPAYLWPMSILTRTLDSFYFLLKAIIFIFVLHTVDFVLFLANLVMPFSSNSKMIPAAFNPDSPPTLSDHPFVHLASIWCRIFGKTGTPKIVWEFCHWKGYDAKTGWSTPSPPAKGESRCPCPAINAMANHNIIPRSGRRITPEQLSAAVYRTYHLSPTLSIQLLAAFEPFYRGRGWFDLEDLGGQNVIQHDGSLLREDISSPEAGSNSPIMTQATPSTALINYYFPDPSATSYSSSSSSTGGWNTSNSNKSTTTSMKAKGMGEKTYSYNDYARVLSHRRWFSWNTTGTFYLSPTQYIFSSGNMALIHQTMGGNLNWVRTWSGIDGFERLPDQYIPACKQNWGMSIFQLQLWTAAIELACGPMDKTRMKGALNDVDANGGPVYGEGGADTDTTSLGTPAAAPASTATTTANTTTNRPGQAQQPIAGR